MFGFKATYIWPFNPKTMDTKTFFLMLSTIADQGNENDYTTNEKAYYNQDWGEEFLLQINFFI